MQDDRIGRRIGLVHRLRESYRPRNTPHDLANADVACADLKAQNGNDDRRNDKDADDAKPARAGEYGSLHDGIPGRCSDAGRAQRGVGASTRQRGCGRRRHRHG